MASDLINYVIHWKKKLDKNPEDKTIVLHAIHKLSKVPITSEILEVTHIGKTIRNLSKRNDDVGEKAKIVLSKWRSVFVDSQSAKNSKQKSINKKHNDEECSSKVKLTQENIAYHEKESSFKQNERHKNSLHHSSLKQSSERECITDYSLYSSPTLDETHEKLFYLKDVSSEQCTDSSALFNRDSPKTYHDDNKRSQSSVPSLKRKFEREEKLEEYTNPDSKKIKSKNHSSTNDKEKKKYKIPEDKVESSNYSVKKEKSSSLHSVKERSFSHTKKSKSNSSKIKKDSDCETLKSKGNVQSTDGFTSVSASFEDCLGLNDVVTVKKKKSSKSQSSTKKPPSPSVHSKSKLPDKKVISNSSDKKVTDHNKVSKSSSHSSKGKQSPNVPKKSTMFDVPKANSPSHSAVQPTFKSSQNQSKKEISNEDVIKFTSSRKEKTAIYSGRKSSNKTFPTLAQCCYRVLIENIDILGPMADTPYELLKPVLEKCSPNQLFSIEKYNPHLLYDTNELWKMHCKRDYKLLTPLEHETWRDVYLRGFDEREVKLKNVTANISASMLKAAPARQLKLAFVDSYVKPPREVLRRQAKHGLLESGMSMVKPESSPRENAKKAETASSSYTNNHNFVTDKKDKMKANKSSHIETSNHLPSSKGNTKPVASIVDPTATDKDTVALSSAAKKPKVAPLMAKTLKTMKQCFRR